MLGEATIDISEARRQLNTLDVRLSSEPIIFVTRHNKKAFAIVDTDCIAAMLEKHPHVHVISDEIYEYINYVGKHESIAQFENIKDRVIIVNGLAKGFAMTGWRIGYIAAPRYIAKACIKLQGQFTSATNSIAQRATITALTHDLAPTYKMRDEFLRRRDIIVALLRDIPHVKTHIPDGAFYVFPDVSYYYRKQYKDTVINNSGDLSMFLLNEALVATVEGEPFGTPECIRLSYASSEENLREAVKRIKRALALLH